MSVSVAALVPIGIALARILQRALDLPDIAAYAEDADKIRTALKRGATPGRTPIENELAARVGALVRRSTHVKDQKAVKDAADAVATVMRKLADNDKLLLLASRDQASFHAEIPKRFAAVRLDVPERGHAAYDSLLAAALTVYIEIAPRSDGTNRAGMLQVLDGLEVLPSVKEDTSAIRELVTELHSSATPPLDWPIMVGTPPDLAAAYQERPDAWSSVTDGWSGSADTVVVTQLVTGDGGHGKSQLARGLFEASDADLRIWVDARTVDTLMTGYAAAATAAGAPVAGDADPATKARAFLDWLANTTRSWLVVLDDLYIDPSDLRGWWPPSTGRTLATTRRTDAAYQAAGRKAVPLGVFSPPEAETYLAQRLSVPGSRSDVLDEAAQLAQDLDYLPVALSQASAVVLDRGDSCANYRRRLADTKLTLADLFPPSAVSAEYHHTVAATWIIALNEAATYSPYAARAALLAAVLDPIGAPEQVWLSEAGRAFLADGGEALTEEDARQALRALHRFSIITHNPDRPWREVVMHAVTQRAVREDPALADAEQQCWHASADALAECWVDTHGAVANESLRANSAVVIASLADALCAGRFHPLLSWRSWSLRTAGLHHQAIDEDHRNLDWCDQRLGPTHSDTLTGRANLANSYWQAGRTKDAINLSKQVLTDCEAILGDKHPDTLTTRNNLATSYQQAGRTTDAITLFKQVLTDREAILGDKHPSTLTTRNNLAISYQDAGRTTDAITLQEQVLTDSETLLGHTHPDTLTARANLAASYWQVGRTTDAITLFKQVLTDSETLLGHTHPDTLITRANLAASYWQVGRTTDAITLLEQVLTDRETILGPTHPDTVAARNMLARWRAATQDEPPSE